MKKLLCFSVIICLLCVSSYAQNDDIIISNATIPTDVMGIQIGEIPTRSQVEKIGLIYGECSTSTQIVASIPSGINWLCSWFRTIIFEDNCIKFGFSTKLGPIAVLVAVEDLEDIFGPYNKVKEENYLAKNETVGYAWVDQKGTVLECHIIKESEAVFSVVCYITPQVLETFNHDYVDLGLSVKWATCNVGASRPEEYGDYYAWGETSTKINYDFDTDKWINIRNGHISLIKYNTKSGYGTVDNKTTLDANDDAANVNWGDHWRMPTDAEWTELRNNCTWTWTKLNGVMGYMVTSNKPGYTDKSLFLPAAGNANGSNVGFKGCYLSSSLNLETPMCAWGVVFDANAITRSSNSARSAGCPIRPVYK